MPNSPEILLDTHVWVWVLEGLADRIGPGTRQLVSRAARGGRLKVSPVSAWEIGMLVRKGRVAFGESCERWVQRAIGAPGLSVSELTPSIAVESSFLPGEFHGDPADRILIASARASGAWLLTADESILAYAQAGHVRASDCRA